MHDIDLGTSSRPSASRRSVSRRELLVTAATLGVLVELIGAWARRKNVTPAQLALAWLTARKPWIVPIPGTTNVAHLEENVAAASVAFSVAEWQELDIALAAIPIQGARLSPSVLAATGVEAPPKR